MQYLKSYTQMIALSISLWVVSCLSKGMCTTRFCPTHYDEEPQWAVALLRRCRSVLPRSRRWVPPPENRRQRESPYRDPLCLQATHQLSRWSPFHDSTMILKLSMVGVYLGKVCGSTACKSYLNGVIVLKRTSGRQLNVLVSMVWLSSGEDQSILVWAQPRSQGWSISPRPFFPQHALLDHKPWKCLELQNIQI